MIMKKIFTIAMLAMSMLAANAADWTCEGLVARSGNNNCSYGETFSWTASSANTMQMFALEAGELSQYATLNFQLSHFTDWSTDGSAGTGNKVRVLFLDAAGTAVKTASFATINANGVTNKSLVLADQMTAEQIASVTEIAFGGSCATASVVLPHEEIKLVKADQTELVCEGLVARKNNNNCKYENRFAWTAASANTMQIFAMEAGTLSQYDTLRITFKNFVDLTPDRDANAKVRVLFLAGSTTVKTQQFYTINNTEKVLDLAELMTAEQIASITEIAVGGNCTAGSVVLDASSIVLYSATATGVEQVVKPAATGRKVIENGQIIIIRDGVRYNAVGTKL